MSEEESKAFVIRDRRGRGEDKEQGSTQSQSPRSAGDARSTGAPSAAPSSSQRHDKPASQPAGHESAMPVTFSGFIFSLSTSAMMLMGEQLDPQQGHVPVNLTQA